MNYIASIFCTFIICHSPQKSSAVQKVYKLALCSSARPFAPYRAFSGQAKVARPAKGSPFGGAGERSETERARTLTNSSAQRSYRSDKEPAYRCAAALGRRACPLRHACGVPPLPKGEALAYRKAQKAPLEVATPRGFFLFGVTILTLDIPDFSISDSPQKSSAVQKVYRRPLRRFAPALPEGEPLAGRVTFH